MKQEAISADRDTAAWSAAIDSLADAERHRAAVAFVSQATFEGVIAAAEAPRATVRAWLPERLQLVSEVRSATHPLLLIFGAQTRGTSRYAGIELEWGTRYDELIVLVPFVRVVRTGLLACYSVAMVCSFGIPNLVGRVAYGFPKELGRLERFGSIHTATTDASGLVFQASVAPVTSWAEGSTAAPPALLARIAALPWIGFGTNGRMIRSYSSWTFDEARVRTTRVRARLHSRLIRDTGDLELEESAPHGFEVQGMVWRLSWPMSVLT